MVRHVGVLSRREGAHLDGRRGHHGEVLAHPAHPGAGLFHLGRGLVRIRQGRLADGRAVGEQEVLREMYAHGDQQKIQKEGFSMLDMKRYLQGLGYEADGFQQPLDKPQLLVATANGATQRVLTPFRVRQLTRRIAEGERIDREALIRQLSALGYQRSDSVAEHGEYAVRGSLIDLFPSGEASALRLDFFGDEIESLRRFDPADQRSTGTAAGFLLMPASEALLDEDNVKRFRAGYREAFGATATGDALQLATGQLAHRRFEKRFQRHTHSPVGWASHSNLGKSLRNTRSRFSPQAFFSAA